MCFTSASTAGKKLKVLCNRDFCNICSKELQTERDITEVSSKKRLHL